MTPKEVLEQLQTLQSQYETTKKQFRTAMIQYETEQTEEARAIFEQRKAQMRGLFDQLNTLAMNSLALQEQTNTAIQAQMQANSQDVHEYTHLKGTASSNLDRLLASYPMLQEMTIRKRLAYLHLVLMLLGIVGVIVTMVMHSRTAPSSSKNTTKNTKNTGNTGNNATKPTGPMARKLAPVNANNNNNTTNALNLNQATKTVQAKATEYSKKALNVADNVVSKGQSTATKAYDAVINTVFGKSPKKIEAPK